jgi:FkbM family methyltransferase
MISRLGWIPLHLTAGIRVPEPFVIRLPAGQRVLYLLRQPEGIGEILYWRGLRQFEPEVQRVLLYHARRARTILDIGANTGIYTLLCLAVNPSATVWGFEPNPAVFRRYREHIVLNGFDARSRSCFCALSDESGVLPLVVPEDHSMTRAARPGEAPSAKVPMLRLDDVVPETEPVDLMKIDVEGHEAHVLRGGERLLSRRRPAIVFECLPGGPADEIEEILRRQNYRLFGLSPSGPVAISRLNPHSVESRNFLALPGGDADSP